MSGVTWLHLSDWHQKGQEFDRRVVRDALMEDIRERQKISPDLAQIDFVAVTGDIAYSGKAEEYEAAVEHFFKPIIDAWGIGDEGWRRLYVVPGNHDIDRASVDRLRSEINISLNEPKAVHDVLGNSWKRNALLSAFNDYSRFVSKYLSENIKTWTGDPAYSYVSRFTANDKQIAILGLNSAWFSARNMINGEPNDYGYLIMGEPQVYDRVRELNNADLVIALMHHPLNWLVDFDRDLIDERLSRHSHFILHGHQHLPRVSVNQSTLGDVVVIPGGASYNRRHSEDPRYTNAYNFVRLDFKANKGTVYLRRWSDQQDQWIADNELYQGGSFQFTLTQGFQLHDPLKKAARHKIMSRYIPYLDKRFCDEIALSIRQTLEDIGGVKVVKHDVHYKIQVSAGPAEDFGMETYSNDRVLELIESGRINVEAYKAHYFKVNGQELKPDKAEKKRLVYWVKLSEEETFIEYKYTLYIKPDDVYLLRLGRFAKKFKFRFRRDKTLVYELKPVGGLPPTDLKSDDLFDYDEMEISELCLPDQGYLVQWNLPDP
jgi:predicted phosphodiesterase